MPQEFVQEKNMTNNANEVIADTDLLCGKIIKSTGGLYTVRTKEGEVYPCRAKGAFRREKMSPLAGDNVKFLLSEDNSGFITEILPRKNSLIRPAAANIDMLLLVVAAANPSPDIFIIDKLTAISAFNGIETAIIINKCDLDNATDLKRIYENSGFKVFDLCANKAEECAGVLSQIKRLTHGKVCFFSGASGVGKSSLLNALYPELLVETGEISKKIARGKHTTRVTELFLTDEDTYIGDTPGFGMVDVAGFNLLTLSGLLPSFPEIDKYAVGCRYTDCTHTCEDGCGVLKAIDEGKIQPTRHESFVKLYKELKAVKIY